MEETGSPEPVPSRTEELQEKGKEIKEDKLWSFGLPLLSGLGLRKRAVGTPRSLKEGWNLRIGNARLWAEEGEVSGPWGTPAFSSTPYPKWHKVMASG